MPNVTFTSTIAMRRGSQVERKEIEQLKGAYEKEYEVGSDTRHLGRILSWAKQVHYNHSSLFQQMKIALFENRAAVMEDRGGFFARIFRSVEVFFLGDSSEKDKSEGVRGDIKEMAEDGVSKNGLEGVQRKAYSQWRSQHFSAYSMMVSGANDLQSELNQSNYIRNRSPRLIMLTGSSVALIGASMMLGGLAVGVAGYVLSVGAFTGFLGMCSDGRFQDGKVAQAARSVIDEIERGRIGDLV